MGRLLSIEGGLVEYSPTQSPALVYLASLAPTGRRAMTSRLKYVAGLFNQAYESVPWQQLRYQHIAAIRSKLQESQLAPATINATIYALRGVARAAFNLGLMSAEDYQRLRDVKPVKGERLPAGRALSVGEITALLDTCNASTIGIRDGALISLMYSSGMRRAELVGLDINHYNQETGELKVLGKGNKERMLYISNGAAEALADWLTTRGNTPGALFNPVTKTGKIQARHMTAQAVYNLLCNRAGAAGIKRFSPHDLRRSFISELLDRGADISTVQQLAGHSNIQTTARYDRRGEKAKRKAQELLYVPYRRKV